MKGNFYKKEMNELTLNINNQVMSEKGANLMYICSPLWKEFR